MYSGTLGPADDRVWRVALTPDGAVAAIGTYSGIVTLWDTASHQEIARLTGPDGTLSALAFSPDGRTLATAHEPYPVGRLAFAPDGAVLAVPMTTGDIELRQIGTGDLVGSLPARLTGQEGQAITDLAFTRDGTVLAAGSSDHTIRLWNVADRTPVGGPLAGHNGPVISLAFLPDGTLASAAMDDTYLRVWDVTAHTPLAAVQTNTNGYQWIAAHPTNGRVVSTTSGGSVHFWKTDPTAVEADICASLRASRPIADQWQDIGGDPDSVPNCPN